MAVDGAAVILGTAVIAGAVTMMDGFQWVPSQQAPCSAARLPAPIRHTMTTTTTARPSIVNTHRRFTVSTVRPLAMRNGARRVTDHIALGTTPISRTMVRAGNVSVRDWTRLIRRTRQDDRL